MKHKDTKAPADLYGCHLHFIDYYFLRTNAYRIIVNMKKCCLSRDALQSKTNFYITAASGRGRRVAAKPPAKQTISNSLIKPTSPLSRLASSLLM